MPTCQFGWPAHKKKHHHPPKKNTLLKCGGSVNGLGSHRWSHCWRGFLLGVWCSSRKPGVRIQSQKSQNEQSSSKDVHLQAAIGHWPTRQGTQMIQTRQKSPTIERERERAIYYIHICIHLQSGHPRLCGQQLRKKDLYMMESYNNGFSSMLLRQMSRPRGAHFPPIIEEISSIKFQWLGMLFTTGKWRLWWQYL